MLTKPNAKLCSLQEVLCIVIIHQMDCYHKLALKFYVKRYTMAQKTRKAGCGLCTAIVVCCLNTGELFTLDLSKEHLHFPLVEGISLSNKTGQEDFYLSTSWKAVKIKKNGRF